MKKDECERAIRQLCHEWKKAEGLAGTADENPNFYKFYGWVQQSHSPYLNFRTTTSVEYDVELWFDQEMKQMWRR